MPNPPTPSGFTASPKTFGTILSYGLEDITITGLLLDSYRRSGKYANVEEIQGQDGIVEGIRMSDFRADVSVSGRVLEAGYGGKAGDVLSINGDNILIMSVDISASSNGFASIDISGTAYEGVSGLSPAD